MYEEATTILAAGDREAANDAVTWLFTRQRANPRSAFAARVRLRLKRPALRALYEFPLSFPASFSLAAVSLSPEMNRSYLKNIRRVL